MLFQKKIVFEILRSVILVIAVLNLAFSSVYVFALEDDSALTSEDFSSSNDIQFYTKGAGCVSVADTPPGYLNGEDNLQKIYNYFLATGLKDYQAAGIVGNIAIESHGDPTIIQGGGHTDDPSTLTTPAHGYGIIQWDPGNRVIDYAKRVGLDPSTVHTLKTQLDIVFWHMKVESPTGYRDFWSRYTKTVRLEEAVARFHEDVEGTTSALPERVAAAKLALGYPKNPSLETGESGSGACLDGSGDGAVAGDRVKTALNYAWPEYHKPPHFTLKPSYAKAVSDAQSKGLYVGGGIHPGIDCGGFITRVMQDSGDDPDYNKSPAGNTVNQENYVKSSGKYTLISNPTTATLKPGDIAINDRHTYMYVGPQPETFKNGEVVASASYSTSGASWRPPMAGHEAAADTMYRWYRLVGGS